MILKVVDRWLLIITALLLPVINIFPQLPAHSNIIFLVTIFLVGIPHGALDHVIHFRNKSVTKMSNFAFYARYILLILVVCFCWYFFPLFAFGIFIVISAYHFGQSQLFYVKGSGVVKSIIFTGWGIFVLSSVITWNYHECLAILSSLEWLKVSAWMSPGLWQVITAGSGVISIAGLLYLTKQRQITRQRMLFEFLLLFLLVLLSARTNAVFTFSIYFGLWHSLRSLIIEFKSLNSSIKNYTPRRFLLHIFPFSLLAITFLVISYYLTPFLLEGLSPYMLFIIFISALTVPHLFIMHDLYENNKVNLLKS